MTPTDPDTPRHQWLLWLGAAVVFGLVVVGFMV